MGLFGFEYDKSNMTLSKNDALKKLIKLVVFCLLIALLCYVFLIPKMGFGQVGMFYSIVIVIYLWIDLIFPNPLTL